MRLAPALLAACGLAGPVASQDDTVGRSEFRRVSELAQLGYESVAADGAGIVLGMRSSDALYLCFIADDKNHQAERQRIVAAALSGESAERAVPNIPMVCVLTE